MIDKLVSCFWPTLELALLSLAIMILVSVPLGILAAVHQNKWCDYMVRALTFLGGVDPQLLDRPDSAAGLWR